MGMIPTGIQWGGELKFQDGIELSASSVTGAYAMFRATAGGWTIATGTGESDRIGRKILVKKVSFRFKIYSAEVGVATASANELQKIRVMVVLDKQANGVGGTLTDVLDTSPITDTTEAFNNLANKNRFVVLMDKKMPWVPPMFDGAGTATYAAKQVQFDFTKKFNNLPIEFSGIAGAQTEVASNQIIVLTTEASSAASSITPTIQWFSRVRFVDG
jgi:hypothetical protein